MVLFIYYEAVFFPSQRFTSQPKGRRRTRLKTTWLESMVALGNDAPEKYRTLAHDPVDPTKEEVVGIAPVNVRPYWVAFLTLRDRALALIERHEIAHIRAVSKPPSHPREQCKEQLDELPWLSE